MGTLGIIKTIAIILSVLVLIYFFYHRHSEKLSPLNQIKIAFIGLVSNFLDTIGIGSFAVIIAMRTMLGVMPDEVRLIGTMNIQAMVTALIQALIFLHFVPLDIVTLLVAVAMIALGGFLSGLVAVRIDKKLVHLIMLVAFIITGILLFLSQLNILTIGGTGTAIRGTRLVIFAIFMLVSGTLPAFGVGYYSLIKASIFLFGVNPIVAFPIMASASAFQMPVTSATFIARGKFYFKSTVILAIFGALGVVLATPIITSVNTYTLKWILLGIVIYNIIVLARKK
ncbi:MAG: hypothetical protein K0R94_1305 [Burkholderiales bacterium]|nr:hypothetical protein [Burkholderiales bacterium]